MKSVLASLPALVVAAAMPSTLLRRQGPPCEVLNGGPGEAAKAAVGDFFRNTYITGQACPQGQDDSKPYS